ncbi:MAG: hypothetical protein HQ446_08770, partial [Polaromonas sp.]|nr:hypothetical protein [Polaromonas sp.]
SITASASLVGSAETLSNYTLTQATGLSAEIAKAALTVTDVSAANKTYDGNTDATVGGTVTGLIDGESLTLSGQFASKDAGTGIAVTVLTADGENGLASNYFVSPEAQTVVANINTPEAPTVPLDIPNNTTLEALNGAASTAASMISTPGLNPTVGELTANTSITTDTTENGVNVVTKQLDDGSRSLQIINGGMTPSSREVDTEEVSAAEITNAATVAGT